MPKVTPRSEVGPSLQVFGGSRSGGRLYQYLRRRWLQEGADPDYWTQCLMMTAVWVRKPLDGGGAGADG